MMLIKNAQGCQGGIRQILKVDTLCYHFQQKNRIYTPNFTVSLWFYWTTKYDAITDAHRRILLFRCTSSDKCQAIDATFVLLI